MAPKQKPGHVGARGLAQGPPAPPTVPGNSWGYSIHYTSAPDPERKNPLAKCPISSVVDFPRRGFLSWAAVCSRRRAGLLRCGRVIFPCHGRLPIAPPPTALRAPLRLRPSSNSNQRCCRTCAAFGQPSFVEENEIASDKRHWRNFRHSALSPPLGWRGAKVQRGGAGVRVAPAFGVAGFVTVC